jgi:hypothetical protein
MTATQSIKTQPPDTRRASSASRVRNRRGAAASPGVERGHAGARATQSPDRPDATRQAGGARILRRWSVKDLIARAGGAPRAIA